MSTVQGIGPDWLRMMAAYNAWQNASLVAAADGLDAAARTTDRGAFFGSIMGTFSHLLWADTIWMSRFDGGEPPPGGIPGSDRLWTGWEAFRTARTAMDARITAWAEAADAATCSGEISWFSGAANRQVTAKRALVFTHFFNHQTHHRGQIHAMLTAAGAKPGGTDLFLMPGADRA